MKTIIANWKMNPAEHKEARALVSFCYDRAKEGAIKTDVVFCPPFVYLAELARQFPDVRFGAQNCFWEEKGAFTGEIAPGMITDAGGAYVIVGHSERRKYFSESNEDINRKLKAAIAAGLSPIVCVGERTREGAGEEEYLGVIERQVHEAFFGIFAEALERVTVAYEPVWAIGTGIPDTPEESLKSVRHIRAVLSEMFEDQNIGERMRVLYGGSVDQKNAEGFLIEKEINGALVGGASLRKEDFWNIVEIAEKYE